MKMICFSVKDTGIGIKPEDLTKLFQTFGKVEQNDSSINKRGVGLGLFISQQIAKLLCPLVTNDKAIFVESTLGEGSEFYFYVQVPEDNEYLDIFEKVLNEPFTNLIQSSSMRNSPTNNSIQKIPLDEIKEPKRILVVDDDLNCQDAIVKMLEKLMNFQISTASNGKDAVEFLKEMSKNGKPIDVVFLDTNMPIMNGLETAKEIKKQITLKLIEKPVIISLSGDNEDNSQDQFIKEGVLCFIQKPISIKKFKKIIDEIFHL
jgi:CheY-like chemotaxis protein